MSEVYPSVSLADLDASEGGIIVFDVKNKYAYITALAWIDGWLTCEHSNYCAGYDYTGPGRFRLDALEYSGFHMEWIDECRDFDNNFAYPVPTLKGVRFANPLVFREEYGCYTLFRDENPAIEMFWELRKQAYLAANHRESCQYYTNQAWRWEACQNSQYFYDRLWELSSEKGYSIHDSHREQPAWRRRWLEKIYLEREERERIDQMMRWEARQEKRKKATLRRIRSKPLKVTPLEMIGSYESITKHQNR